MEYIHYTREQSRYQEAWLNFNYTYQIVGKFVF